MVVQSNTTVVPELFGKGDKAVLGKGRAESRPSVTTDKLAGCVGVVLGNRSSERTVGVVLGNRSSERSIASSADTATRRRGEKEHEEQTSDGSGRPPGSSTSTRHGCDSLSARQPCEPVAPQYIREFFACNMDDNVAVSPVTRAPMLWHRDTQRQQLTHTKNDGIAVACYSSTQLKQHASAGRCGPNDSFPRCLALRLGCGTSSLLQIAISDIEASAAVDARLAGILELLTQPTVHMCGSQCGTHITEIRCTFDKFHTLPTDCAWRESLPGGPAPQICISPCGKGDDGVNFHSHNELHWVMNPGPSDVSETLNPKVHD